LAETIAERLEALYERYNRREFVSPDPIEFLYRYDDPGDREIVGLVASSLAYGRVGQINRSVAAALEKIGPSPSRFLKEIPAPSLRRAFSGFRHRFTSGDEMADMLLGVRAVVEKYGSPGRLFQGMLRSGDTDGARGCGSFCRETVLCVCGLPQQSPPFTRKGKLLQKAAPLPSLDGAPRRYRPRRLG